MLTIEHSLVVKLRVVVMREQHFIALAAIRLELNEVVKEVLHLWGIDQGLLRITTEDAYLNVLPIKVGTSQNQVASL